MLYLPKSTLVRVVDRPIVSGGSVANEGAALVQQGEAGVQGVTQSTGSANDRFAGVAIFERADPAYLAKVEDLVAVLATGATYPKVTLAKTPVGVAANRRVVDMTTGTVLTDGAPSNANEYLLTGLDIEVATTREGHTIRVYYRYSPTVAEARFIQGDIAPGGANAYNFDRVGVIEVGDVFTSEFDAGVDWTGDNLVIRTGANGIFTTAGSGTIVDGYVIHAPTPEYPFLGLSIR